MRRRLLLLALTVLTATGLSLVSDGTAHAADYSYVNTYQWCDPEHEACANVRVIMEVDRSAANPQVVYVRAITRVWCVLTASPSITRACRYVSPDNATTWENVNGNTSGPLTNTNGTNCTAACPASVLQTITPWSAGRPQPVVLWAQWFGDFCPNSVAAFQCSGDKWYSSPHVAFT